MELRKEPGDFSFERATIGTTGSRRSSSAEQYRIMESGIPVNYGRFLDLLCLDKGFRSFFNSVLVGSKFSAFRFETPPVTVELIEREFEFVLLSSKYLEGRIDKRSFSEHFSETSSVVVFPNLGRDGTMVVPCPVGADSCYGHLASFVRQADENQIDFFWQTVGVTVTKEISEQPLWLNTHGGGVAWLHMRLDSRPKYYGHDQYRKI